MSVFDLLRDPETAGLDVDGSDRLILHRKILDKKPMLRGVFQDFHNLFDRINRGFFSGDGSSIELGAGVAPMRDDYPYVLSTDIVPGANLDFCLNAEKMNLPDSSVRVFFGQNCFHHFPTPENFFSELMRVLVDGGGAVLLEPYFGFVARNFYKRLFSTETFDMENRSWESPLSGPMKGANQALSYIVFVRDRSLFEKKFPCLNIVHAELCGNYLRYLLSGGLNFRSLCPHVLAPVVRFMEWMLSPFNRWLCLHHVVVIRKNSLKSRNE